MKNLRYDELQNVCRHTNGCGQENAPAGKPDGNAGTDKTDSWDSLTADELWHYIEVTSEDVAMKTGIRLPIVTRIIRTETDILNEWSKDEEKMAKPAMSLAKHICSRTGIYLPTVLTVMDTESELASLIERYHDVFEDGCEDCDDCEDYEGGSGCDGRETGMGFISMSEMVGLLHERTGICPKLIDRLIQLEDEVLEERGISSAYHCMEDE